jgi:hypothetical protein
LDIDVRILYVRFTCFDQFLKEKKLPQKRLSQEADRGDMSESHSNTVSIVSLSATGDLSRIAAIKKDLSQMGGGSVSLQLGIPGDPKIAMACYDTHVSIYWAIWGCLA